MIRCEGCSWFVYDHEDRCPARTQQSRHQTCCSECTAFKNSPADTRQRVCRYCNGHYTREIGMCNTCYGIYLLNSYNSEDVPDALEV